MAVSRAYLDSYYLLEMVKPTPDSDVKKMFYKIKNDSFEVFVSQTVLGEVVAKLFPTPTQYGKDALSKLPEILKKHNIDLATYLTPPRDGAFEIMCYLNNKDPRLDNTDIMILSHALADPLQVFLHN